MRAERTPPVRRYWAVILCLILGTLLGVWHNRQTDRGKPDLIAGSVRGTIAPPADALGKVSHWFSQQTSWIFRGRGAEEENQRLKAQMAALEGENATLREAQIKYDRLRDDLGFVQSVKIKPLAADVIARHADHKFDTLVISRGSRDGIKIHSVVMAPEGLVGQVADVGFNTATVLLLTDQNSGVGARVQRAESRATGICKGHNLPLISLQDLPTEADIKLGDRVVTSGLGGIYPAGLVIGTVMEVKPEEGAISKTAKLKPRVDFNRLEEVYVLP